MDVSSGAVVFLLAIILLLVIPVCISDERRKQLIKFFRTCRCVAIEPSDYNNDTSGSSNQQQQRQRRNSQEGQYSYVLSQAQEDEIRDSYIRDKLNLFTQTLTASDIHVGPASTAKLNLSERMLKEDENTTSSDSTVGDPVVQLHSFDVEMADSPGEAERNDEALHVSMSSCSVDTVVTTPLHNVELQSNDDEGQDSNGNSDALVDLEAGKPASNLNAMLFDDFMGFIVVPLAGEHAIRMEDDGGERLKEKSIRRKVTNGCAICLSSFVVDEQVTWSANPKCDHVFHHACIVDWFNSSGKKETLAVLQQSQRVQSDMARRVERQRRREARAQGSGLVVLNSTSNRTSDSGSNVSSGGGQECDPIQQITSFSMLCPCCRQSFCLTEEAVPVKHV